MTPVSGIIDVTLVSNYHSFYIIVESTEFISNNLALMFHNLCMLVLLLLNYDISMLYISMQKCGGKSWMLSWLGQKNKCTQRPMNQMCTNLLINVEKCH